ncbi:DUF736 family protein [Roseovarius rhodophyticola]|uniref:DUF736 family protein n=1 Tax=Roseovarius rhodophyticola TaxID=3080827 RepID=UPI0029366179|nr:DUF736 family protein [Roseovarius sp. W115]MDV2927906.1 DUF736 family protein [Roseovarius sp. W115]
MTTNCIKFEGADIKAAGGFGSISTLTVGIDIIVEPVASVNPMAPTHRFFGRSLRGRLFESGGIWKKRHRESGADYFTLIIRDYSFNADPGNVANQEDAVLQAMILLGVERSLSTVPGGAICLAGGFTAVNLHGLMDSEYSPICQLRH